MSRSVGPSSHPRKTSPTCEPGGRAARWPSVELVPPRPRYRPISEENVADIASLVRHLGGFQAKTKSLHKAMARLLGDLTLYSNEQSLFTSVEVSITSLLPEPFKVIAPIKVVVQGTGDDYTATFFDANIGSSGETQQEAVDNLKELLIMSFESLEHDTADGLGPQMKKQKVVLESFIQRA